MILFLSLRRLKTEFPQYSYAPMSYADPAGQALPSKSQGISDNETPALMAGEEG
jgi:hypothetical protein